MRGNKSGTRTHPSLITFSFSLTGPFAFVVELLMGVIVSAQPGVQSHVTQACWQGPLQSCGSSLGVGVGAFTSCLAGKPYSTD